ncbi:ATP-binding protein [uncultured Litoreibacter sp.]|uniref:ATP-binding protein n=1 Tax=uncultured Litoreibacter sp. TaxID=1392394 RepID=UPI00260805B1|nr:ATP-binding protein [uncultured Litoreibacter sp.]
MFNLRTLLGLLLASGITTLTAAFMLRNDAAQEEDLLRAEALNARDLIVHDLKVRVSAIERMGRRIAGSDGLTGEQFDLEADSYLRDMPGFWALGWVDTDYVLRHGAPARAERLVGVSLADIGKGRLELAQRAAASTMIELSPPVILNGDQTMGFVGAKSVWRGDDWIGTLWVVFKASEWIENLYFGAGSDMMRDISFAVMLDGEPIYLTPDFQASEARSATAPAIPFGNSKLSVQVKATEAFRAKSSNSLTYIVSALVGVLALSSTIAVFALRGSMVQGRRAAQANEDLTRTNRRMHLEVSQRRKAEVEAKRSSAAKSQFLSTMSHEIRTPMNGVLGMAELLSNTKMEKTQRGYVDAIEQSGRALMVMISDMLDFSKFESGEIDLTPEPTDVRALIAEAADMLTANAEKKGLLIRFCPDNNLPAEGMFDRAYLRQVAVNLIRNAIKFTNAGVITVGLSYEDGLVLKVKDTGIGIAPEKIKAIFEEFEQADGDTSRPYEGTGLGLSIVDRLVRAMDGEIEVNSKVGEGSEFTLRLPWDIPANPLPSHTRTDEPAARSAADLKAAKVLLAEDNLTNQRIVSAFLRGTVDRLDIANDGIEALQLYRSGVYDAVLMDVSMPNRNGFETTKLIRQLERYRAERTTPIIGFTANCGKEDQQKCREAGMDDVLAKPATKTELADRLAHWVGRPSTVGLALAANA